MKARPQLLYTLDIVPKACRAQPRRFVHTSRTQHASIAPVSPPHLIPRPQSSNKESPLARLPLSDVVRTYLITLMSSSPPLLDACFAILNGMLKSKSIITDVERNVLLNWVLKKTFYAQFCAGEHQKEILDSLNSVKALGYEGVILEFALEVLAKDTANSTADSEATLKEIEAWRKGMVESVRMTSPGDFIGLKWSGLGVHALHLLRQNLPPTPQMERTIHEVCDLAAEKGVTLLPGAEEVATNGGIHAWTLKLQQRYNRNGPGKAIMYSTFQAYLKSTPDNIAMHLAAAKKDGYTLGVKLVRGAYLNSEPRHLIWDTKEDTDHAYDSVAESLLRRKYGDILRPTSGVEGESFPDIDVILATHNHDSVHKAEAIRKEQIATGKERVKLSYAQLKGMADEVSCSLLQLGDSQITTDRPKVFKCVPFGTTTECLEYLLRRASENKDAAARTEDTKNAMAAELWRRLKTGFGLA